MKKVAKFYKKNPIIKFILLGVNSLLALVLFISLFIPLFELNMIIENSFGLIKDNENINMLLILPILIMVVMLVITALSNIFKKDLKEKEQKIVYLFIPLLTAIVCLVMVITFNLMPIWSNSESNELFGQFVSKYIGSILVIVSSVIAILFNCATALFAVLVENGIIDLKVQKKKK